MFFFILALSVVNASLSKHRDTFSAFVDGHSGSGRNQKDSYKEGIATLEKDQPAIISGCADSALKLELCLQESVIESLRTVDFLETGLEIGEDGLKLRDDLPNVGILAAYLDFANAEVQYLLEASTETAEHETPTQNSLSRDIFDGIVSEFKHYTDVELGHVHVLSSFLHNPVATAEKVKEEVLDCYWHPLACVENALKAGAKEATNNPALQVAIGMGKALQNRIPDNPISNYLERIGKSIGDTINDISNIFIHPANTMTALKAAGSELFSDPLGTLRGAILDDMVDCSNSANIESCVLNVQGSIGVIRKELKKLHDAADAIGESNEDTDNNLQAFLEGFTGDLSGTAEGLFKIVAHPDNAIAGLAIALDDPVDIAIKLADECTQSKSECAGKMTFEVAFVLLTAGSGEAVDAATFSGKYGTEASQAEKIMDVESKFGERAGREVSTYFEEMNAKVGEETPSTVEEPTTTPDSESPISSEQSDQPHTEEDSCVRRRSIGLYRRMPTTCPKVSKIEYLSTDNLGNEMENMRVIEFGQKALIEDADLTKVAQGILKNFVEGKKFGHELDKVVWTEMGMDQEKGGIMLSNLGLRATDADVVAAWRSSPIHSAHLNNERFTHTGFAKVKVPLPENYEEAFYYCQVFWTKT